jgi:histone H4
LNGIKKNIFSLFKILYGANSKKYFFRTAASIVQMSSSQATGVGVGKSAHHMFGGKGTGKLGAKRFMKTSKHADEVNGITKPSIRRLARRSGIKRISTYTYSETRANLKAFLQTIVSDALIYTKHARRKTMTASDVVYSLKKNGHKIYGYGGYNV